ncbi:hypothetical protein [Kandleria vitulina]|uniref:hypothetical protein n=1 Tax=Kandleria vitulina TaxID=1630 RepID=UPI00333089C1
MKMNKPYIEIVRFDAEDVIATSGVVNCLVKPLSEGDRVLHYNRNSNNYFVYDRNSNSNISVDNLGDNTALQHNGGHTQYTDAIKHPESSNTGYSYSAYVYNGKDWYWWDDDNVPHDDY